MKRFILAAAVLPLALVAGACSAVSPDAARINGSTVKRFDFEQDLRDVEQAFVDANAATAKANKTPAPSLAPATPRADAAALLTVELQAAVVHDELVNRKLTPSTLPATDATLLEAGRAGLAQDVFDKLPKSMQSKWLQRGRERLALQQAIGSTTTIDDAAIKARYDQDSGTYLEVCFSAIVLKDSTDLATAQSQLTSGKSFADVAAAISTDASAADKGVIKEGTEPCWLASDLQAQLSQVYTVLQSLPVGTPSQPLQTTGGFILLQTDKVGPAAIERVRDTIANTLQQEQAQVVPKLVNDLLTKATVKVDPRYGDWDATSGAVVATKTLDPAAPAGAETTTVAATG